MSPQAAVRIAGQSANAIEATSFLTRWRIYCRSHPSQGIRDASASTVTCETIDGALSRLTQKVVAMRQVRGQSFMVRELERAISWLETGRLPCARTSSS